MTRQRILIIDDEPDSVYLLRFALERAGFEVATAKSAREALPLAQRNEPDLVLLDLVLRDESGLEICRALRADDATRTLPIILVTGKLRTEFDTVEGFRSGADDYVMKPFRPAEVVARVETLLERTRRLREISSLTALPGAGATQARLHRLVGKEQGWGVLFCDLNGFAKYNDAYGFERGDEVLRALAQIVASAASEKSDFVGHEGGDKFLVATTPQHMEPIAREAISAWQNALPNFYPADVLARGDMITRDRRGNETSHPLLSLAVAGVSDELRSFRNPLQVSAVASELKKALKTMRGSNYKKDVRTDR